MSSKSFKRRILLLLTSLTRDHSHLKPQPAELIWLNVAFFSPPAGLNQITSAFLQEAAEKIIVKKKKKKERL